MGLFGFLVLIVLMLAIVGLGWKTFSSGVIVGLDKVVDVGTPIIKDLTQEAKDFVNSPERIRSTQ